MRIPSLLLSPTATMTTTERWRSFTLPLLSNIAGAAEGFFRGGDLFTGRRKSSLRAQGCQSGSRNSHHILWITMLALGTSAFTGTSNTVLHTLQQIDWETTGSPACRGGGGESCDCVGWKKTIRPTLESCCRGRQRGGRGADGRKGFPSGFPTLE